MSDHTVQMVCQLEKRTFQRNPSGLRRTNTSRVMSSIYTERMKLLVSILFVTIFLVSCTDSNSVSEGRKSDNIASDANDRELTVIDAKLPLFLNRINPHDSGNILHLNDGIVTKIEDIICRYTVPNTNGSENSPAYRYLNTIRISNNNTSIYLVLFNNTRGYINGRVLFYDNYRKRFYQKEHPINLFAMYKFNGKWVNTSRLRSKCKTHLPDIDSLDYNSDGIVDYRFTVIQNNGHFHGIQTTILTIKNDSITYLKSDVNQLTIKECD